MSKSTEDSKIKKDELISDDNTELTDEALEQVNGGTFQLKKETQPYSSAGKASFKDLNMTKKVDN